MINKYILNIGLNDKDTKTQIIKTSKALETIKNTLFNNNIVGYTIYTGYGLYKHDSGEITKEKTIIIEMFYTDDNTINNIINDLKVKLNQESITKQVVKMSISFE